MVEPMCQNRFSLSQLPGENPNILFSASCRSLLLVTTPGKHFTPICIQNYCVIGLNFRNMFYFLLHACKLSVVVPLYHDQWVCCTVVNHKWHLTAVGGDFTAECDLFTWNGVYKNLNCLAVVWPCRALNRCPGISEHSNRVRRAATTSDTFSFCECLWKL